MKNLKDRVSEALAIKPPQRSWFLVTFRDGKTGAFTCAVILQGDSSVAAAFEAYGMDNVAGQLSSHDDIPSERVPPAEYCNRALTADDLKAIWPDFFERVQ